MALKVDLAGSCQTMLAYMADLQKGNYPLNARRPTGTLDMLLDPSNGRVQMDNAQLGRKYYETKVTYKIPTKRCEILTDSAVGGLCDTAQEPPLS